MWSATCVRSPLAASADERQTLRNSAFLAYRQCQHDGNDSCSKHGLVTDRGKSGASKSKGAIERNPWISAGSAASRRSGVWNPPEPWETGFKDTVVAYPGQVTRVRAQFNTAGQFVWHCHIVEHEDNEMMRRYRIGPLQPGQPK